MFWILIAVVIGLILLLRVSMNAAKRSRLMRLNIARHDYAYDLLRFHAYSDDKLNRSEIDIIAAYMQTIPGYVYDATSFKKALPLNVPGLTRVPTLIAGAQAHLSNPEIEVLVDHLEMLRGTKKRHAPAVAEWYDRTLRELKPAVRTPPGPVVNDLRLA